MEYNGLPVFNAYLTSDDEELLCNSLVDDPAVCKNFLLFAKDKKKQLIFTNTEQHIVTGVSILADTPIYRADNYWGYYVVFTKEEIKKFVEKYNKKGYQNLISLQHDGKPLDGITMIESYFINKERGIYPKEFEDCPDGSWITSYHVDNEDLWELLKTDKVNGFSIEIVATLKPKPDEELMYDDPDLIDDLIEWLEFDEVKKKITRGNVKDVIDSNRQVDITVGEQVLHNQQIFQIGKDNTGSDVVVVYDPNKTTWDTIQLKQINNLRLLDTELENFNFNLSWKQIVNNLTELTITDTKPTSQKGKNDLNYIIENNLYTLISYDDEEEGAATGFRTCFVSSWGYTVKGNECIRIYEYSGATRTGFQDGRWRLLLTRRIMDLKAADYMDAITTAPPLYNGELKAGSGINGTMESVIKISNL